MSDQQFSDEPIVTVPWVPSRSESADSCCPVTIFQLLQAEPSPHFGDKSLLIEGKGFAVVELVANVKSVEINPGTAIYVLEDGTGRIKARQKFQSLDPKQLSRRVTEEEVSQCLALEHTFVKVIGTASKINFLPSTVWITSIHPVQSFHQVMYHIYYAIHSTIATEQLIEPLHSSDGDHTTHITPAILPQVFPNTFSPQKHHLYVTLKPLERAIMMCMHNHKNKHVLVTELAQTIQVSYGCTEYQFNVAFQELLSEAYLTSPLDDGYVVITPRH